MPRRRVLTRAPSSNHARRAARMLRSLIGAFGVIALVTPIAIAEDRSANVVERRLPPADTLFPERFVGEVHVGFAAPLENGSVCPSVGGCVLQSGGGVGGSFERRRPSGFGWLAGYDLVFLGSDAVYELGVQQLVRLGARYTAPTDIIFHPTFDLSAGAHVYGDTFHVATFGALLQVFSGAEIELSETYAVRGGFGLRILTQSAFRTERDGIRRARTERPSEMLFAEVALVFM
jgi:hypothetical protein